MHRPSIQLWRIPEDGDVHLAPCLVKRRLNDPIRDAEQPNYTMHIECISYYVTWQWAEFADNNMLVLFLSKKRGPAHDVRRCLTLVAAKYGHSSTLSLESMHTRKILDGWVLVGIRNRLPSSLLIRNYIARAGRFTLWTFGCIGVHSESCTLHDDWYGLALVGKANIQRIGSPSNPSNLLRDNCHSPATTWWFVSPASTASQKEQINHTVNDDNEDSSKVFQL